MTIKDNIRFERAKQLPKQHWQFIVDNIRKATPLMHDDLTNEIFRIYRPNMAAHLKQMKIQCHVCRERMILELVGLLPYYIELLKREKLLSHVH